ncbi:hypothetical protein FA15DRAFT_276743 [Coprinopsis marcescibilis]|uniref:Uncharacterized protein n=1 Tax=Coprinopsis marcescibilis TaxID=230819 RepID=A0A5C3L1S3_COPMA|nr:hypothetical protein FA15DRAFT_276743 [Coprinopsis marcescibilis]
MKLLQDLKPTTGHNHFNSGDVFPSALSPPKDCLMRGLSEITSSMPTLGTSFSDDDYEDEYSTIGIRAEPHDSTSEWISPWGPDDDSDAAGLIIPGSKQPLCVRPSFGGIVHPVDRDISEDRVRKIHIQRNGKINSRPASIRHINALCMQTTPPHTSGMVDLDFEHMLITNTSGRTLASFQTIPTRRPQ